MNTSKHNIYPMTNLCDLENNIFIGQGVSALVEKSTTPTPLFYTTGGCSYHAPGVKRAVSELRTVCEYAFLQAAKPPVEIMYFYKRLS